MALCMIIEDDSAQRGIIRTLLEFEGFEVVEAASGQEAIDLIDGCRPETVLLDLGLPDADGLDLIPVLLARSPLSRIIVLTGANDAATAVTALRSGARHYLVKPWDENELIHVLQREANQVDHDESTRRTAESSIFWGQHPAMTTIRQRIRQLSVSPWTPVLILGETGTGKEVVASELHRSTENGGPMVALNCASVPRELLESELFGHEKGSFTGADNRRRGLAEIARNGTLFLDEIGEMSPDLQAKLLRFLQDHTFRRVGGSEQIESQCRIIAATHQDLDAMIEDGRFRVDLYYRLAVIQLEIPPLRKRRNDIVPLANVLSQQVSGSLGVPIKPFHREAEKALREHGWRGNVRELRNRIERAFVLAEGSLIFPDDLDLPDRPKEMRNEGSDEAKHLRRVLEESQWNVSEAARRLGVERHWLRYRMRKHDITVPI
jgi:DNA-binding NtrC family response regulator